MSLQQSRRLLALLFILAVLVASTVSLPHAAAQSTAKPRTITVQETAALARELMPEDNRVVLATAPEKAGLTAVSESALTAALRAGVTATVTPWRDEVEGRALLAKVPTGGAVPVINRRQMLSLVPRECRRFVPAYA